MAELYAVTPTTVITAGATLGDYYSLDNVARYVMRAINTQSNDTAKQVALEGIMSAVADLGARHHFKWGAGVATDIAIVDGQAEYDISAIATNLLALRNVQIIDKAGSKDQARRLHHILWDQWKEEYQTEQEGMPRSWTTFDLVTDKTITIWPEPKNPNDLWLRVEYYEEVVVPPFNQGTLVIGDDGTTGLAAPRQLCEAIIHFAKAHLLRIYEPDKVQLWRFHQQQYEKALEAEKGRENREHGGPIQFRLLGGGDRNSHRGWWPR